METKTFKVLKFGRIYVDENLLSKGIYETNRPYIRSEDATIENIIITTRVALKFLNPLCDLSSYIENIRQCELVEVELVEKTTKKEQ